MHGYLRDNMSGCCMALEEKVFVGEENLQDDQKRREEEKVRNGKLHRENLLRKLQLAGEESCGCLRNGLLKTGKEGKAMQSNAKAWYGRLSLSDIF